MNFSALSSLKINRKFLTVFSISFFLIIFAIIYFSIAPKDTLAYLMEKAWRHCDSQADCSPDYSDNYCCGETVCNDQINYTCGYWPLSFDTVCIPYEGGTNIVYHDPCALGASCNPGCTPPPAACEDGFDNDGDGLVDYGQDPGCTSFGDNDEYNAPGPKACEDGLDNDGDGLIDYGQDPGCTGFTDNDEY